MLTCVHGASAAYVCRPVSGNMPRQLASVVASQLVYAGKRQFAARMDVFIARLVALANSVRVGVIMIHCNIWAPLLHLRAFAG
jgi:hypothetical protein